MYADARLSIQLHEQGKTDQAKADLARLTKIRAEREAAAAKRKAETEGEFLALLLCTGIYRPFQPKPRKSMSNERKLSRRARDSRVLQQRHSMRNRYNNCYLLYSTDSASKVMGRIVTCTDMMSRGLCNER